MSFVVRIVAMMLVVVMVGGCATSGPKFSQAAVKAASADMGRIYFYRTAQLGAAVQPEVKLNGVVVGRAVPNGWFYVDRKPGTYEITTTTEIQHKLTLALNQGQVRYVQLSVGIGLFVWQIYPKLMDDDIGRKEMQDLHLTES